MKFLIFFISFASYSLRGMTVTRCLFNEGVSFFASSSASFSPYKMLSNTVFFTHYVPPLRSFLAYQSSFDLISFCVGKIVLFFLSIYGNQVYRLYENKIYKTNPCPSAFSFSIQGNSGFSKPTGSFHNRIFFRMF